MGEIKSTLDLVMEKTKHLTLSNEEKAAQRRAEVGKKIYGLVRKYQDNMIAKTYMEKEMDLLKNSYDVNVEDMLTQTLLADLKLAGKNDALLELLRDICGKDISNFEKIFQEFLAQVEDAAKDRAKTIKDDLQKKQSISGTAVIPNLEADKQWLAMLNEIKVKFDKDLDREKAALSR